MRNNKSLQPTQLAVECATVAMATAASAALGDYIERPQCTSAGLLIMDKPEWVCRWSPTVLLLFASWTHRSAHNTQRYQNKAGGALRSHTTKRPGSSLYVAMSGKLLLRRSEQQTRQTCADVWAKNQFVDTRDTGASMGRRVWGRGGSRPPRAFAHSRMLWLFCSK